MLLGLICEVKERKEVGVYLKCSPDIFDVRGYYTQTESAQKMRIQPRNATRREPKGFDMVFDGVNGIIQVFFGECEMLEIEKDFRRKRCEYATLNGEEDKRTRRMVVSLSPIRIHVDEQNNVYSPNNSILTSI